MKSNIGILASDILTNWNMFCCARKSIKIEEVERFLKELNIDNVNQILDIYGCNNPYRELFFKFIDWRK